MPRLYATLLITALLGACAFDLTGPRTHDGLPAGLEVSLTVDPAQVSPHEPFTVRFRATNTTSSPIRITTAHGCLVVPGVFRNGTRIPFQGTALGCTAAITHHDFEPGATRELTWEMRAELYAQYHGDPENAPAPKGSYRVQAEFDTLLADSLDGKPRVEAVLQVR